MAGGWTGKSLLVELDGLTAVSFDRPALRESYLGGRGYGVALVAELGSPGLPPLHPSQPFVLAAGPLTGSTAPSSGRFAAVAPSPLTGTIFDSNAGGRFGVRLRGAGLDALVLTGRAPSWSVLVVDGRRGGVRAGATLTVGAPDRGVGLLALHSLCPDLDAGDPGLTSSRLTAALRKALGGGFSLVFPSVAGRRGALLGSVRTDDRRNLGRGGMGAALAAKRIAAVAVAGDDPPEMAEPGRFSFLVYEAGKLLDANPVTSRALPEFGTAVLMQLVNAAGALPARNYQLSTWGGVDAVSGETLRERMVTGRRGCFGCRIRCTPRVASGCSGSGEQHARAAGGTTDEGPEYESLWALGPDCGVDDLDAIGEANRLCGEYGLDTISTGATIACAMELGEAGVLGRSLGFGDPERLLELVREMGEGRGFGQELADGSARFAARYAHPQAAVHVKGLELPGYDPRGMHGQGLAYATSNRGACHLRGNMLGPEILGIPKLLDRLETGGKAGILVNLQHLSAAFDSACLCKFAGFAFGEEILARLLSAATGVHLAAQDLLQAGERIWNLERLWNLAAGFTGQDDKLPARLLPDGQLDGQLGHPAQAPPPGPRSRPVDLAPMLDEYYRARGWTEAGAPGEEKLRALGLADVAVSLAARGRGVAGREERQGWRAVSHAGGAAGGAGEGIGGPLDQGAQAGDDGEARHLRAV